MGNSYSSMVLKQMNFEDIQIVIKHPDIYTLINTLPINEQECLILNTIPIHSEEFLINQLLKRNKQSFIVIYGKNVYDVSIYKKYKQLTALGFTNVHVYAGGLFEWALLQDIYTAEHFPTVGTFTDILQYKPSAKITSHLHRIPMIMK